ncbi:MAG TPA: GGDEF domain-containing protein [Polyangiaceae bacterium]|nr:GGDEF domain-containing protein [Polyangiaceae bacterium]
MPDDPKQTQKLPPLDPSGVDERPSSPRTAAEWADEESSTRTTEATLAMPPPTARKQTTRALLTVVSGPNIGRVYSVRDGETVLGRGKEAHVRMEDAGASRAHARIVLGEGGRYVLEDLKSTNGTFVAGRRVEQAELSSGDRIHIGPNIVVSFAILDAQAERLAHQHYESSVRDPLTRAHNRRYLVERLASEIAYARRHASRLALILFDLDHFKRVNDTSGHLAGDEVLRDLAALVSRMIRAEDVFARFGGEEFVILVRGISHANVGRFAERLRSAVERLEIVHDDAVLKVTISAGYSSLDEFPDADRSPETMLRVADERLYRAKTGGRNRVCGR